MRRIAHRSALVFAVVVVASGLAAAALAAKPASLRITAPGRVFQGKVVVVTATSKSLGCKLSVRYSNGETQAAMTPTRASKEGVSWQWKVPDFAAAGQARLTVACPGARKATRSVIVVGNLIPPKVTVVKQGFSPKVQGSRESVSYGLVLQNTSPNANALGVGVLVNFVLPDGHLIGSVSKSIPIINAGSTYNLGGDVGFNGNPAIAKLEIVIDPGGRARSAKTFLPGLDNVHLVPNSSEPSWLGSVEGDIVNVHPTLTLNNSSMSCVVLDGNGNVLGGGSGSAYFKLLPGTRSFFKITGGLGEIPFNKAASVSISLIPNYEQSASP
jgi:hypothetical protein